MKWQTFQVMNFTAEQIGDADFHERAQSSYENFKRYRAEVIDAGLFIVSLRQGCLI